MEAGDHLTAQGEPQQVIAPPAKAAIFLTATVPAGHEDAAREALADVPALTRSVGFRIPETQLTGVVGIGADLWDRMYQAPRPEHLHAFEPVTGTKHQAVSTPGDLLLHLRARQMDVCFELARQIMLRFGDAAVSVDEVHGFRYWDERDLLGFVDGTENPAPDSAAAKVALIEDGNVYAGGSYVIVQKYLHDLTAWEQLSVEQQELVIGRTKLNDIELADDVKPSNSHVTLNTIEEPDGTEREIVRDNLPFGSVGSGEYGTYFIGYAADPTVTELMLRRMFVGEPPGNYDRILDFSTAVTGCLFFVPPADFLEDPEPFLARPRAG